MQRPPGIVWPLFGYDNERVKCRRASGAGAAVPAAGGSARASCSSSRPRSPTGSSTSRTIRARSSRSTCTGQASGATSRSAALRPRRRSTEASSTRSFMNRPPCNAQGASRPRRTSRRVRRAHRRSSLAADDRPERDVAGRRERPVYVGDWHGYVYAFRARTGRLRWSFTTRRPGQGRRRRRRQQALRRLVRRARLRARARDGTPDLARGGPGRGSADSGTFYATPAAAYGRVYIGTTDGKVYSFGATTGKLRWSHPTG